MRGKGCGRATREEREIRVDCEEVPSAVTREGGPRRAALIATTYPGEK